MTKQIFKVAVYIKVDMNPYVYYELFINQNHMFLTLILLPHPHIYVYAIVSLIRGLDTKYG